MTRVLLIIAIAMLMIYAIVEVAQADPERVRVMPRWLWAVAVILLPAVGAVCWLLFGRPTRHDIGSGSPRPPRAPDDDPDFLRNL